MRSKDVTERARERERVRGAYAEDDRNSGIRVSEGSNVEIKKPIVFE